MVCILARLLPLKAASRALHIVLDVANHASAHPTDTIISHEFRRQPAQARHATLPKATLEEALGNIRNAHPVQQKPSANGPKVVDADGIHCEGVPVPLLWGERLGQGLEEHRRYAPQPGCKDSRVGHQSPTLGKVCQGLRIKVIDNRYGLTRYSMH